MYRVFSCYKPLLEYVVLGATCVNTRKTQFNDTISYTLISNNQIELLYKVNN